MRKNHVSRKATCPTAKGRLLKIVNTDWWIADERNARRASCPK